MSVRVAGTGGFARGGWLLAVALSAAACGGVEPGAGAGDGAVSSLDDASSQTETAVVAGDDGGAIAPPADVPGVDGARADAPLGVTDAPAGDDSVVIIADAGAAPSDTPPATPDTPEAPGCIAMDCPRGACSLSLNLDVPVATVTGRITQNGSTWPTTSTRSGGHVSASSDFLLRATDTRTLHTLASISYSNTAPYVRPAGSDVFSTTVIPGSYELLYRRGENGLEVGARFNNDPIVTGFRVLRTVTISPGTQTLNLDVPVATVTGRVTQNGSTWPMTSARSGGSVEAYADFLLRSADTGALHVVNSIGYGSTAPYTRPAGSDAFSTTVIPGTYEVLYRRAFSRGDVGRQFNNDPVPTGFRVLRTVTITPGTQTLNIDVPVATVTGRVTQNGSTWPMTSARSGGSVEAYADFLLRSADTGALHVVNSIGYGSTAPYVRTAGSDAFSTTVIPGTYEVLYRRAWSNGDVGRQFNNDPVLTGFRVLRTVSITTGTQPLNIDVPLATVTGRVTQNGATLPMTSSRGDGLDGYAEFFLRAADTGALHTIASIAYNGTAPYARAAGSDAFSSTTIPGTYTLIYRRASSGGVVGGRFNNDPVVTGDRVLRTVTITPGMQTLNIDLPVVNVSGRITQAGSSWPTTSTRSGVSGSASADFYLRARDTLALHRIASIRYGDTAPYTRPGGSDVYASTLLPGAYDLVYGRGWDGVDVAGRLNNDPVVTGFRTLRTCVSVP